MRNLLLLPIQVEVEQYFLKWRFFVFVVTGFEIQLSLMLLLLLLFLLWLPLPRLRSWARANDDAHASGFCVNVSAFFKPPCSFPAQTLIQKLRLEQGCTLRAKSRNRCYIFLPLFKGGTCHGIKCVAECSRCQYSVNYIMSKMSPECKSSFNLIK